MEPTTLYSTLVLSGFVLIGMEIFIPGGLLGIIGALIWLAPRPSDIFSLTPPGTPKCHRAPFSAYPHLHSMDALFSQKPDGPRSHVKRQSQPLSIAYRTQHSRWSHG